MTSAYHPQSDGQPEVVNKIITMQQNHHYVPTLLDRGQTKRMGQIVALGRVLLSSITLPTTNLFTLHHSNWSMDTTLHISKLTVQVMLQYLRLMNYLQSVISFYNKPKYVSYGPKITIANTMIVST